MDDKGIVGSLEHEQNLTEVAGVLVKWRIRESGLSILPRMSETWLVSQTTSHQVLHVLPDLEVTVHHRHRIKGQQCHGWNKDTDRTQDDHIGRHTVH